MALGLDHLVIFTAVDAPEADTLTSLGLAGYGGITRHGDLGTASTSFFFENTYLELFWAHDFAHAQPVMQTVGFDLDARVHWRHTGASPYGIMFYRADDAPIPFPTQTLHVEGMPGDLDFASSADAEPYFGVVPPPLEYRTFSANFPSTAFEHPLGVKRVTGIRIEFSSPTLSAIARRLSASGLVNFEIGMSPLLELTFDGGAQGKTLDARPSLPLILKL
jgi:hypothetical protein